MATAAGGRSVSALAHIARRNKRQIDWAHFGKLTIGRAQRPLMAFVMVLSYSRHLFVRFYLNAGTASFLDAHVQAFAYFTAVPQSLSL